MKPKKFKDPITHRYKYSVDFTCANERHRPVADSADELYDIIDAIKKKARARRYGLVVEPEIVTLGELVTARKDVFDTEHNIVHRRRYKLLNLFRDCLGADRDVRALTTADIYTFVQKLRRDHKNLKASSLNVYLMPVASMLHAAELYFPSLQTWKCPRIPYEKVPRGMAERTRLTDENEREGLICALHAPRAKQEQRLSVTNRQTVADLFQCGHMTGFRLGELRTLRWLNVKFSANLIRTVAGKTGQPIEAVMNETLRRIMLRRWESRRSEWVFENAHATGPIHQNVVYEAMKRAALEAQITYGREDGGFTFHDARRTAITEMIEGGVPFPTIQSRTGQTRERVLQYAQALRDSKERSAEVLEKRFGEKADKKSSAQSG